MTAGNSPRVIFPKVTPEVLRQFLIRMSEGVKVAYVTGNHDEVLRRYTGFRPGNFLLDAKFLLTINDQMIWFFHGDVFDRSMKHGKWLARLGGFRI